MKFFKWLPLGIIFMAGWKMALPVTDEPMPWVLQPIQVVHGVFIHEALLLLYFALLLPLRFRLPEFQNSKISILVSVMLIFGALMLFSNAINIFAGNQEMREIGEPLRIFLLALLTFCIFRWSQIYGETLLLRTFLIGIVLSGAINLYLTFYIKSRVLSGLPSLLGQSGPGGALAISAMLGALLMTLRTNRIDGVIAILSGLIGIFAATISFSKLAMLISVCASIAWFAIMIKSLRNEKIRRWIVATMVLLWVIAAYNWNTLMDYKKGVEYFISLKFNDVGSENDNSSATRLQYIFTTLDIMTDNPIFGVGTGGFYTGARETPGYYSSILDENPESGRTGKTNPHNAILYYASALGLPGFILTTGIFLYGMVLLWSALRDKKTIGAIVWFCLACAYTVHVFTLPSLFNTMVFYLPCAIACSINTERRNRCVSTKKAIFD